MKKLTTVISLLALGVCAIGQDLKLSEVAQTTHEGDWVSMYPGTRITSNGFFENFSDDLGLSVLDHFVLKASSQDELGFVHYRYQQYHGDLPIDGAEYILHLKDGILVRANGKLVRLKVQNASPVLSADESIAAAQEFMGAEMYYWQMPEMERRIKHATKDPHATFYPTPELVFADADFGRGLDHKLAWKLDVYADGPAGRKIIYVNAANGEILFALEGCHEGSATGTAETRYHGTQTIVTDSVSPTEFRLIDVTRGGGIETYDMNEEDSIPLAVDFLDDDNYWNNANAEMDEAATDAHWGAEMTYDYYLQMHGRDSYDDNGSAMISYIHYNQNWFNASWNGLWARFGDGNNNPLTAIDVVSHEFTHGVTGNSAGLIYQNESGALNESFSDIFGNAVEFFALQDSADWLIGKANFTLRNMANPGAYGDPDTYQGSNWYNGPLDNGGVHTNSGVQNFWFYLLSNGGTGTNDNGDDYAVDSLGIEKAGAIAYRNLNTYLTSSSTYADARAGALHAAEDLYGSCSFEVLQVMEAWYAVGMGLDTITHDAQMLYVTAPGSSCEIGPSENVSVCFRYNRTGCGHALNAGDSITVGYRMNGGSPVQENLILNGPLIGGDTICYTFQSTVDLSGPGVYEIDVWTALEGDLVIDNDTLFGHTVTSAYSLNSDEVIAFEVLPQVEDSFYVVTRANSEAHIKPLAANTGVRGFQLNGMGASPGNVDIPITEADNFILNPEFGSSICFCVDASSWSNVRLSFDLQQTFSEFYLVLLGFDWNNASSLRIMVDGTQIGDQFHPTTYDNDPYLTHVYDLDQYAGMQFEVCFEGKHFVRQQDIPGSLGDNTFLDNIFLTEQPIVGVDELVETAINIYPVPTNGDLVIELDGLGEQNISIVDMAGKEVLQQQWNATGGPLTLDLSEFAKGLYTMTITSEKVNVVRRVIVQ